MLYKRFVFNLHRNYGDKKKVNLTFVKKLYSTSHFDSLLSRVVLKNINIIQFYCEHLKTYVQKCWK